MTKDAKYIIIIGALILVILFLLVRKPIKPLDTRPTTGHENVSNKNDGEKDIKASTGGSIDELTREETVVPFVKKNKSLPACYITKAEARRRGWNAGDGNLCDVLPGKAIGGDRFTNRERTLPVAPGRVWFEADLNYNCGHRNADRLLFSSDGLVYVTYNHYKNFIEK